MGRKETERKAEEEAQRADKQAKRRAQEQTARESELAEQKIAQAATVRQLQCEIEVLRKTVAKERRKSYHSQFLPIARRSTVTERRRAKTVTTRRQGKNQFDELFPEIEYADG